jgi:nucleoside-diphosphate-sugar epimerase
LAPDHQIFENNTLSTYNVFQACRRLGIKRIVWASSETLLGLPFETPPPFAPLDETISSPEWSYALTKQVGEVMAEAFVRWAPDISITSLRFSNVFGPDDYAMIPQIQAQPDGRKMNLWGYVDARDCGEACRLALEKALPGHEAFIIAAGDNVAGVPSAELMGRLFPSVPLRGALEGAQSLLSTEKAKRLLGYQPRYSWRDPQLA